MKWWARFRFTQPYEGWILRRAIKVNSVILANLVIGKIDGILSTDNQPPSARAADIVLATMWQARRGS